MIKISHKKPHLAEMEESSIMPKATPVNSKEAVKSEDNEIIMENILEVREISRKESFSNQDILQ